MHQGNAQIQKALTAEIKTIQGRCVEAIQIVENAPPEAPVPSEELNQKTLCYVEGLRTEIQNSSTPINTDDNLLTSQFLSEIKEKTIQMEEFGAFLRGSINDVDVEINRLAEQIRIAEEARARPRLQKQQISPEHVKSAKDQFHLLKNELHGLIHSLYPDKANAMKDVLGILMSEKLKETSNGYIPITTDNYCLIQLLLERSVVSINPYNEMEVKLAY